MTITTCCKNCKRTRIETPKHYQRLWATLLQQGIDAGELRHDLDVKVTGYAILGMCNWVYRWYNPEGKLPAEAIATIFTKIILEDWSGPKPLRPRGRQDLPSCPAPCALRLRIVLPLYQTNSASPHLLLPLGTPFGELFPHPQFLG